VSAAIATAPRRVVFTGTSFIGPGNSSGVGTEDAATRRSNKQLFASASSVF